VAEFLVHEGYKSTDWLIAHGISSGGLLVGAVANLRPELIQEIVTQVPYWPPTKWVAKLRGLKTGENVLLLKANLGAQGHAGPSDRLESWRETAFLYAFILDLVGIDE
jgi:protease II